ncbi:MULTISPECIES: MFS transporter [unclassified Sphingobium]|uniref:MFS transporter n=1 Tax=unclassified Sphingobium TaxID=2611147 RepID=UPI002224B2BA|nr:MULTISPECIES: MFS transporter [unclassified Sphingobium]MCW2385732.1 MFS family permease [Sphingobium sp. B2D3D]
MSICAMVYFLDGLVHTIMGPLAPEFAPMLGLGDADLGPIFSANLIGQCIGLIAFPPLAARFGDRWTVGLTLAGFGAAQALTGLANSAEQLFWMRLVTGVLLGGCLPSCLAIVTAAAPVQRRGLAITFLFTGYGLGATIAGIVAIAFTGLGGWRVAMGAVGLLCLATSVITIMVLRDAEEVAPQSDAPQPRASPLSLLAPHYRLGTTMLWFVFIAMLTISYCLSSWLPVLLVRLGYAPAFAALALSIFSFGGIAAALCMGLLIDRYGAYRVLVSSLLIAAAFFFVAGQIVGASSALVLQLVLAVCGFFALGAYGGVNVILASFYPPRLRSTGIGWAKSVGRIGTVAAPVLIGAQLEAGIAETTILASFAVPAIAAAIALIAMKVFKRRGVATEGV